MANRGYDVVVDVDAENLLQLARNMSIPINADLLFPPLPDFNDTSNSRSKIPPDTLPFPATTNTSTSSTLSSKRYLWSLSFYAQFFDVDTPDVLTRCRTALYPRSNFLDVLDGNPDLYGPFWIATTVVFILFLTGTISLYLASEGKGHFEYDFKLLSGAAGLIYGYTGIIPIAVWALLKWFGSESASVLECWALYGYANLIWIPVALVSWSQIGILNWVFVAVGFAISALFLVRNLYPLVNAMRDAKTSKILLIAVVLAHAGLAVGIKFLCFASAAVKGDGEKEEMVVRSLLGL
ncbi:hypothetical protein MMC09_003597 [Bachmanniomyces sp. S44760]|nr:hypothetical protein [Bachmanniomyces sp. S44760]